MNLFININICLSLYEKLIELISWELFSSKLLFSLILILQIKLISITSELLTLFLSKLNIATFKSFNPKATIFLFFYIFIILIFLSTIILFPIFSFLYKSFIFNVVTLYFAKFIPYFFTKF